MSKLFIATIRIRHLWHTVGPTVILAILLPFACSPTYQATPIRPSRIILISMDTVRADRVSGYGTAQTTPVLAEISQQGVLFRDFYAASTYTIPSHLSIFTGRDSTEVMLPSGKMRPDVVTLTELLAAEGYRTRAYHEGGYVSASFGFDRGFEKYIELPRIAVVGQSLDRVLGAMHAAKNQPYFLFLHTYAAHFPYGGYERYRSEYPDRNLLSDDEIKHLHELARDKKTSITSRQTQTEILFYNHLVTRNEDMIPMDRIKLPVEFIHSPYFELDRQALLASYDERIRLIDKAIGRIRATLIELGQWEDTLLIILSDHGEAFFEHGLQQHAYIPFDEVLKVPLIISYPRVLKNAPVRQIEGLTWHPDILPTIGGLVGFPLPQPMTGMDLTQVLLGNEQIPKNRMIFPSVQEGLHKPPKPRKRTTLRDGLKHIQGHVDFGDELGYLFDLRVDSEEMNNLREKHPSDFDAIANAAVRWSKTHTLSVEASRGDRPVHLSKDDHDKLRALGYIGN